MNAVEINNKTRDKINAKLAKSVAEKFLAYHKVSNKEVSLAFVGDSTIKKLNRIYRGKDKVTDILSFSGERQFLGEIIIDYAQVKRQARRSGKSATGEMIFILVHGLLHLLGYDDKTEGEAGEMEALGEKFININLQITKI